MAYCILRTQKLKAEISILRSLKHAFRAQPTPNADPARTPRNQHVGASSAAEAMAKFRAALPEKRRKNGVLAIEYLVAFSPEARGKFEESRYFSDALSWLRKKHGAENVIYAGVHYDETTPHMYAYVVPRDPKTGKLNCRHFLGGSDALSKMQTDFAQAVGEPHGLERGLKGSKARHTRVSEWYAGVNASEPKITPVELPEPSLSDRLKPKEYAQRAVELAQQHLVPQVNASKAKALKLNDTQQQLRNTQKLAKQETKRAEQAQIRATAAEDIARLFSAEQIAQARLAATQRQAQLQTHQKAQGIEAEKQRRIEALPTLLHKVVGAAVTFVMYALDALKRAQGRQVNWKIVEHAAAKEATTQNGQSAVSVAHMLCEISPGRADPDSHAVLHDWALKEGLLLEKEYEQNRDQRDSDHEK